MDGRMLLSDGESNGGSVGEGRALWVRVHLSGARHGFCLLRSLFLTIVVLNLF